MLLHYKLRNYLHLLNGREIQFELVQVGFDYIEVLILGEKFCYRLENGKLKISY